MRYEYGLAKKAEKDAGKKNKKLRKMPEFDQEISVEKHLGDHEDEESESDEEDIAPQHRHVDHPES